MPNTDPQFLYLILVLPGLFGLTLIGDGVHKFTQEEEIGGIISIAFGLLFLAAVVGIFLFFSSSLHIGV